MTVLPKYMKFAKDVTTTGYFIIAHPAWGHEANRNDKISYVTTTAAFEKLTQPEKEARVVELKARCLLDLGDLNAGNVDAVLARRRPGYRRRHTRGCATGAAGTGSQIADSPRPVAQAQAGGASEIRLPQPAPMA